MNTHTRTTIIVAAIFVLALALRLAWIAYTDTEIPPLSDPQYYHATASNLADGRGYTVAVDERGFVASPAGEPTAFWAPGYPFTLAPLYAVFGSDARVAQVFNAIVGALTVVPVWFLGRRLAVRAKRKGSSDEVPVETGGAAASSAPTTAFGSPHELGGIVPALLFAVCPALVFWTPALFSEPLFTFGVACTLAVALWASERTSWWTWCVVGIVLAATALVRSQGMVLLVPVAVLAVAQGRGLPATGKLRDGDSRLIESQRYRPTKILPWAGQRRYALNDDVRGSILAIACVMLGMAVLLVPWAARNQHAMESPYLINDNLGYNLRLAHAPYSTGTSIAPRDLWDERPGISFRERELWWAEVGTSRAWDYARTHPGDEARLAVKRVGWLLRSDAAPAMRWSESLGVTQIAHGRDALVLLGDVYWYGLLAIAAASLFVVRRDRVWWAMWSTLGVWVALHLVFAGEPRYHVPVVPVLCVLASAPIVRALETQRRRGTADRSEPS